MGLNSDSKPNWQPWNDDEFVADRRIRRLNQIQRWMYRALCQAAFFCSTRPYLPTDDDELWLLADCDDKQTWLDNSRPVLALLFKTEKDGVPLYGQKRVVDDWNRIAEKRAKLSANGRKGAEGKWMANAIPSQPDANHLDGQESKQVSKEESEAREVSEGDDMDFQKRKDASRALPELSGDILKKSEKKETFGAALKELLNSYDRDAVVEAFKAWAYAQPQPYPYERPISAFLRVASKLIDSGVGEVVSPERPGVSQQEIVHLLDNIALYSDNNVVFNAGQKLVVIRLANEYGADDVLAAFKEFYSSVDDNSKPYAARDFTEKGEQFVRTRVTKRRQAEQQTQFLTEQTEIQERRAAEELAAIEAAEQEEIAKAEIL